MCNIRSVGLCTEPRVKTKRGPLRYFRTAPEIIRPGVMLYVRFPLSMRNVEDLLHERGVEISRETVRFRRNRFGPMFVAAIRKKRFQVLRSFSHTRWHLDGACVRTNGMTHCSWRAVDHEGDVLEDFVSRKRDRKAALKFRR